MIIKEREIPLKILKLQALERRLSNAHPKKAVVQEEIKGRNSGYYGEKALDYYIHSDLERKFHILHDLRLSNGKHHFQIDTLLLSPYFMLLIEVKNFSGTITLDSNLDQMIHCNKNQKRIYDNPLLQVRWQQLQLSNWIHDKTKLSLIYNHLVVFTNSSTLIEIVPPSVAYDKICRLKQLPFIIKELESRYTTTVISDRQVKSLARLLLKKHEPLLTIDILDQYKIPISNLIKGVQCPKCNCFSMKWISASWICPICHHKSKEAHIRAVQDYFLLLDTFITNRQFRDFLQLSCPDVATRLLASMKLPSIGENKGRRYFNP